MLSIGLHLVDSLPPTASAGATHGTVNGSVSPSGFSCLHERLLHSTITPRCLPRQLPVAARSTSRPARFVQLSSSEIEAAPCAILPWLARLRRDGNDEDGDSSPRKATSLAAFPAFRYLYPQLSRKLESSGIVSRAGRDSVPGPTWYRGAAVGRGMDEPHHRR